MASKYYRQVRPRYQSLRQAAARRAIASNINPDAWIKDIGTLAKTIQANQAKTQQDAIANQIMNTRNAPRAGLVTSPSGQGLRIDPKTGQQVPFVIPKNLQGRTAGTTPFGGMIANPAKQAALVNQGGMEGLKARADAQRLIDAADPVGTAVAKAKAMQAVKGSSSSGSRSSGRSSGTGKAAAAPKAAAEPKKTAAQIKEEIAAAKLGVTDPSKYNFGNLRAEINAQYGKDEKDDVYGRMAPYLGNVKNNVNELPAGMNMKTGKPVGGTGFVKDGQGGLLFYEDGNLAHHIWPGDTAKYEGKLNVARNNMGLNPVNFGNLQSVGDTFDKQGNRIPGPNPGSASNPYRLDPNDPFSVYSVPIGSHYIDDQGRDRVQMSNAEKQQVKQSAQAEQYIQGTSPTREEQQFAENLTPTGRAPGETGGLTTTAYDEPETPEDQQLIDAIQAQQAQRGTQPSDFYAGSPASSPVTVTGGGEQGPASPSDYYAGSPALQPSSNINPSDLYAGSPSVPASYLDTSTPQVPPPDVSPQVTGQAASEAAAPVFNTASQEYVGVPPAQPTPAVPYNYLSGY